MRLKNLGKPSVIPVGYTKPTTFNDAVLQILYNSGNMTQEQYLSALGIAYDFNSSKEFENDYAESDDGFEQFEQSGYARYEYGIPNELGKDSNKESSTNESASTNEVSSNDLSKSESVGVSRNDNSEKSESGTSESNSFGTDTGGKS